MDQSSVNSTKIKKTAKKSGIINWVNRWIYLYNVTFGLYMLDWWERCLFNLLLFFLLWSCYNGSVRVGSYLLSRIFHLLCCT
ncbi:hypothetical protein AMTRI_Chr13g92530 [Amborella trichopoda]